MKDESVAIQVKSSHFHPSSLIPHPCFSRFILFILLAFIAYSNVLDSYFLSDDFVVIGKLLAGNWAVTWGLEHGGFFRPLFVWSVGADYFVWGRNPVGYHVTNVLLHGVNSFLVYATASRLLRGREFRAEFKRAGPWAAALLFLFHPSHTEAVSWVAGRADLLATLFSLTALLAFLAYNDRRSARVFAIALLSFALALLAKESAVSLPPIMIVAGIVARPEAKGREFIKRLLKASAPFFLLLLLFILVRTLALGSIVGGYGARQHLNFSPAWIRDRFVQAMLRSTVPALPESLSDLLLKPLKSTAFILFASVVAAIIIALLARRRRVVDSRARRDENMLALSLVIMFMLGLAPVVNLRLSLFDTQGERFLYWPSVFFSILAAFIAATLLRNMKAWLVLAACLLVFYSASLYRTNRTWREAGALTENIVREVAESATREKLLFINAPDNLRGVPVFHNGLEDALRYFQTAKRIETARVVALHDLGSADDELELKKEGDALSLQLLNVYERFVSINDRVDCVEVLERSGARLRVRLKGCPPDVEIFFFNRGRIYRLLLE